MSKETLKIGIDLGIEKDEQCAVINLHYNGINHIIYETHNKEQVETLSKIMEAENRKLINNANPSEALECLNNIEADLIGLPKHITEYDEGFDNYLEDIEDNIDKVEQALLKAQANARSEEILQKYYQEGITLDSVRALKQERDNYKKALKIIKEKIIWVEDDKLMCGRYADTEIELEEEDFENKEEFNLLKEVLE